MPDLPPGYHPLADFAAAARGRAEAWRTALGFMLILLISIAGSYALGALLIGRYGSVLGSVIGAAMVRGASPGMVLLLLFSFLTMAAAPLAVVRSLHGRRAGTLFGHPARIWPEFRKAAGAALLVNLALLPFVLGDPAIERGIDLPTLLLYLVPALIGLAIQTSAEELIFRGYLLQQFAARSANPVGWMFLPSAIFAAGHYAPDIYGPNSLAICVWTFFFGCLAADLTARTGGLGAAIGLHFANNAAAFLLVGNRGEMDGLALWTRAVDLAAPLAPSELLVQAVLLLVAWLAARLALAR